MTIQLFPAPSILRAYRASPQLPGMRIPDVARLYSGAAKSRGVIVEAFVISPLEVLDESVEVVERKGLGHPDTICDALAETLSRNLCREYRQRFGTILHHNVDKALLAGGQAEPAYGGGRVLVPISIYLAGQAIAHVGKDAVPITEIATEGSRRWLRANLHALDAERHVRIHSLIRAGSSDLQALFSRGSKSKTPLANDTSIGVGYAPMSPLEQLVLSVEKRINGRNRGEHSAWGEDVKVMGVRNGNAVHLTIACAMIGRHLSHLDDYLAEKTAVKELVEALVEQHGFSSSEAVINSADDPSTGVIYLTVTGTSAECGDDGQVGRGNRINGVITPGRPMSLEAAAGKNPVTHVGKIYNVLAREISQTLAKEISEVAAAQCLLVSRIGAPVTSPGLIHLKLRTRDGLPVGQLRRRAEEIATDCLSRIPKFIDEFVDGTIEVF
jgi:S-adenosylmethionine synthetase